MSDLLIEIFTEELPARFIDGAEAQMTQRVSQHLDMDQIVHGEIHGYATPRRLVTIVDGVQELTEDRTLEVRGPAVAVSYDGEGNPTPALLGFCKGQGIDPAQVFTNDVGGKPYIFARKTVAGQESGLLIEGFLSQLPREITFPKMMHWEQSGFQFGRPIRGLVALLGTRVLHWSIAGVEGSNTTFGLRVGKPKPITVSSPEDYLRKLREAFVILDPAERRRSIEKQADKLLKPLGYSLAADREDLLAEVVNLVEYPTAFLGSLPGIAVELPESVVRSVLQEQMHSFLVYDEQHRVVPHFLSIRNGLSDFIDIVRRGNESVANARLLDASFFIAEDTRQPLEAYVPKLNTLIFMDQLGTMADKTARLEQLAASVASFASLEADEREHLSRAAHLAKADLATSMVKEYTSLQGEIGGIYLMREGEAAAVATAVREQYMPRSPSEAIPSTRVGQILGIIDKVDTLTGILGTGFNPSGSEDPYGVRRAGNGIIRTILESRGPVDVETLVRKSVDVYLAQLVLPAPDDLPGHVLDYLKGRVTQYFKEKQLLGEFSPMENLPLKELGSVPERMTALQAARGDEALPALADSHRRIQNITKGLPEASSLPDDLLVTEPEEVQLRDVASTALPMLRAALDQRNYAEAIRICERMVPAITTFFDRILVMAGDERVRSARLLLLCHLKYILGQVCDYAKLT